MKNVDIASLQQRRYETYEKEKANLIVVRVSDGYEVTNVQKATNYRVSRNPDTGRVECTCRDYYNYREYDIKCKHKICVIKKCSTPKVRKAMNSTQVDEDNNINKEEIIMSNINKFNPQNHLMKVKGKDYLEVKYRVHWFRTEHPDYSIKTEITYLDIEKGIAVVRADVYDSTGKHLSTGHKMEYQKHFFDYAEKSETGAIGRALACLGYGTLQCFDMEEGIEKCRIVDAPVTPPSATAKVINPVIPTLPKATATTSTASTGKPAPSPVKPAVINPTNASSVPTTTVTCSTTKPGNGKGGNGKGGDISKIIEKW